MLADLLPSSDIFFWFLLRKSAFVKDFSDILTNNKFNNKFGAFYPTPYLNPLIPIYLITLINTLGKNKSAAEVAGTDLQQNLSPVVLAGPERRGESLIE